MPQLSLSNLCAQGGASSARAIGQNWRAARPPARLPMYRETPGRDGRLPARPLVPYPHAWSLSILCVGEPVGTGGSPDLRIPNRIVHLPSCPPTKQRRAATSSEWQRKALSTTEQAGQAAKLATAPAAHATRTAADCLPGQASTRLERPAKFGGAAQAK